MNIAAYQAKAIYGDRIKAIKIITEVLTSTDADIVCFPECYLTGYFRRLPEALTESIDLSSNDFEEVLAALKPFSQTVILGLIERDEEDLFNTAVVIKQGELLGKYRKQHVNELAFVAGNQPFVFNQDGIKIGINICNDANYPETAKELANLEASVIIYPLNNSLPKQTAKKWQNKHILNLITRARDCNAWIVAADVVEDSIDSIGYGCTAIVSPEGIVVARQLELQDGLITFNILFDHKC